MSIPTTTPAAQFSFLNQRAYSLSLALPSAVASATVFVNCSLQLPDSFATSKSNSALGDDATPSPLDNTGPSALILVAPTAQTRFIAFEVAVVPGGAVSISRTCNSRGERPTECIAKSLPLAAFLASTGMPCLVDLALHIAFPEVSGTCDVTLTMSSPASNNDNVPHTIAARFELDDVLRDIRDRGCDIHFGALLEAATIQRLPPPLPQDQARREVLWAVGSASTGMAPSVPPRPAAAVPGVVDPFVMMAMMAGAGRGGAPPFMPPAGPNNMMMMPPPFMPPPQAMMPPPPFMHHAMMMPPQSMAPSPFTPVSLVPPPFTPHGMMPSPFMPPPPPPVAPGNAWAGPTLADIAAFTAASQHCSGAYPPLPAASPPGMSGAARAQDPTAILDAAVAKIFDGSTTSSSSSSSSSSDADDDDEHHALLQRNNLPVVGRVVGGAPAAASTAAPAIVEGRVLMPTRAEQKAQRKAIKQEQRALKKDEKKADREAHRALKKDEKQAERDAKRAHRAEKKEKRSKHQKH